MGIRPLHDRVLVEPLTAEEKTAGGIIIPDTAQEKPQEGKIVAVGNGAKGDDGKAQRPALPHKAALRDAEEEDPHQEQFQHHRRRRAGNDPFGA